VNDNDQPNQELLGRICADQIVRIHPASRFWFPASWLPTTSSSS